MTAFVSHRQISQPIHLSTALAAVKSCQLSHRWTTGRSNWKTWQTNTLVGFQFNSEQFAFQFRLTCTLALIASVSSVVSEKALNALTQCFKDRNSIFNSIYNHHYHLCCHHQHPLLQQWAAQTVECLLFPGGFYRTAGQAPSLPLLFLCPKVYHHPILLSICTESSSWS